MSSLAGEIAPLLVLGQSQLLFLLTCVDLPRPVSVTVSCVLCPVSVTVSVILCGTLKQTLRRLGFSPWEVLSSLALCTSSSHDLDLSGLQLPPLYSGGPPGPMEVPLLALHPEDSLGASHQAFPSLNSFSPVS